MKRTLFYSLLALGATALASGQVLTVVNPWNGSDNTWTITGSAATDFAVVGTLDPWTNSWGNRTASQDTILGSNLGDNRRFSSTLTVASGDLSTSTQFLSFTVTNNSSIAYDIDSFSYGVGRNVQTSAWLYSSVTIGATTTALTASASASTSSSVGAGGWDQPLVQFGPSSGANAWAKPVYDSIPLTLGVGETAEFRIYLTSAANSFFHLNNLEVEMTAIPEPSTYAALFGLLAIGFVAWRRRRRA